MSMKHAAAIVLLLVLLVLYAGPAEARRYPPLFNSSEIPSTNFALNKVQLVNWGDMLKRWKGGAPCQTPTCSNTTWAGLIAQVKAAGDPMAEVKRANELINARPYIEDPPNWNKADYWATAFEFLKKNGDCEDFSITKYMLLKAAGYPVENMRIFTVRLRNYGNTGHAILVIYDANTAWVLDNRSKYVVEASRLALEFEPTISLNEQFWWIHLRSH
jgi:predicted transglutaminase-like cysteine proteinase